MPRQQRRTCTTEFKKQMVQLHENGKSRAAIVEEYDLTASALDRWIKQSQATGSFKEKDNRSPEENELIALRKKPASPNGERHFKASRADHGMKVAIIQNNRALRGKRSHVCEGRSSVALHCVLMDLFHREIISHSAGPHQDVALVSRAFATVEGDLSQIQWFHTYPWK